MKKIPFSISKLSLFIFLTIFVSSCHAVEFNTDVLDSNDKKNIDFTRFSQEGYILPGKYHLNVTLNGKNVSAGEETVNFYETNNENEDELPKACLNQQIVNKFGLTESSFNKIKWIRDNQCADFSELSGVIINADLSEGKLNINMPQAWLEYSDLSWLPPSRWEDGINGILLDYNVNGNITKPNDGNDSQSLSYNGTTGLNLNAWRIRADYQGSFTRLEGRSNSTSSQSDWTRFYAYRAIPRFQSKLMLGENYINSDIFNSWSYTGFSFESDDRMLPPKLRGYAPQITGIADTNARVIVKQQDRILYDGTVPAGPFTIQDIDSSVRGRLNVEIIESNGLKKQFDVDTAYVPYLTRPGQVRYKYFGGRSRNMGHTLEGPYFTGAELSWGVSNNWSLYGGSVLSADYNALAIGVGRDLQNWGTISSDVTQSFANLDKETKNGKSWRVSYSKRFDEVNTDITFSGYKFSERDYLTMQQYIDSRYHDNTLGQDKELYTISVNKYLTDLHTSVNLQYSHQTYWDQRPSDYYTASVNRYFDVFGLKNLSVGLTASRTRYKGKDNDSMYLRLSLPLGTGMVNYSGSMNDNRVTQTIGYSDSLNDGQSNYSLNAGVNHDDKDSRAVQMNGYYSSQNSLADLTASFAMVQDSYTAFSIGLNGGATITAKGGALHSGGINGGTRMLVSTDGIANVPIDGGFVKTNFWGKGVVPNVSSYYRNTISVDLNKLPDDMEATRSVVESALTEGAIGYREFEVLKGIRIFAILTMKDGSHPPFGSSVLNSKGLELGMVGDDGLVWLSGVNPNDSLRISWDGSVKCLAEIPDKLKSEQQLLLPCRA